MFGFVNAIFKNSLDIIWEIFYAVGVKNPIAITPGPPWVPTELPIWEMYRESVLS